MGVLRTLWAVGRGRRPRDAGRKVQTSSSKVRVFWDLRPGRDCSWRYWEPPAVQWSGLGAFTAAAQVQSVVRELRSYKPFGQEKKKGNNTVLCA